jgi:hypothetical protein
MQIVSSDYAAIISAHDYCDFITGARESGFDNTVLIFAVPSFFYACKFYIALIQRFQEINNENNHHEFRIS